MHTLYIAVFIVGFHLACPFISLAQPQEKQQPAPSAGRLKLQTAVMCEDIRDHDPENQAIVFPVAAGKVSCFTFFNPVPEKTVVYHIWYHRDKVATKKKLILDPPFWKTYSSIQLREDDKGPWRVEITDQAEKCLKVLRFSITD